MTTEVRRMMAPEGHEAYFIYPKSKCNHPFPSVRDRAPNPAHTLLWLMSSTLTVDEVKECIGKGSDPGACNFCYDTPLLMAIKHNNLPVVRFLVEECQEPLNIIPQRHEVPLWTAVEYNNIDMVKLLLSLGADPLVKSDAIRQRRFPSLLHLIEAHLSVPRSVACYVHETSNFAAIYDLLKKK